MSNRPHHFMPWGHQHQGQGQMQGQKEYQDQDQGQGQGQGQHQEQSSSNHNANGNGNGNLNGNANGNANANLNYNANGAHNAASNEATNAAVNAASNINDTSVTTTVKTNVDVNADLDLSGYMPTDDDFADIDMSGKASVDTLLVGKGDISFDPGNEQDISDILTDALNGAGNDSGTVNSQFNNLVDNDVLHSASNDGYLSQTNTSYGGTATSDDGIGVGSDADDAGWDFHIKGKPGHGGHDDDGDGASSGNWGSNNGDDGYVSGESLSSAASAIDTTAFNQSIVMGANVLGNTVDMNVVGGNMSATSVGDDSTDAI